MDGRPSVSSYFSRAARAIGSTVSLAAAFILRLQGADGGFGSYEPKRVPFSLEWLNPAEMFGDSMTEKSYVECTASCVAAMAAYRHRFEGTHTGTLPMEIDASIQRATAQLRISGKPSLLSFRELHHHECGDGLSPSPTRAATRRT